MDDRPNLQTVFEELLESENVYFQPPESVKMKYPAIRYELDYIDIKHAENSVYNSRNRYKVILITPDPESLVIKKIIMLPMCRFVQHYKSDNLNHYVYELYY